LVPLKYEQAIGCNFLGRNKEWGTMKWVYVGCVFAYFVE